MSRPRTAVTTGEKRRQGREAARWTSPLAGRRLVVASNRPPISPAQDGASRWEKGIGGLVSALGPAMEALGGTWIAAGRKGGPRRWRTPGAPFDVRLVPLTPAEEDGYYLGYANRVLWPICHLRLERVQFRESNWQDYRRVNLRFAKALAAEARDRRDIVWIHDYHLALVPRMLRARAPRIPSAFFWHIPWPSYYVFRSNPTRRDILLGLLGADVVAFQTALFARNFITCCREEFGAEVRIEGTTVHRAGHATRVEAFGASVDVEDIEQRARSARVARAAAALRATFAPRPRMRIGLGVDRLDYAKGILRRFQAIETFFERHPTYRGRFVFIQVAGSTRSRIPAYLEYRTQVVHRAEEVNRRIGRRGWTPIRLVTGGLSPEALLAHYRAADVLLVTSVADGMNLVAKEFVAAQADDRGLPVISEMAGVAADLPEAIHVNPFDIDGIAEAMAIALATPKERRRAALAAMRDRLHVNTTYDWLSRNLSALEAVVRAPSRPGRRTPGRRR